MHRINHNQWNLFFLEKIGQIQPVVPGRLDQHNGLGFPKFVYRSRDTLVQLLELMHDWITGNDFFKHTSPYIEEKQA
jgi:hypothetical protein